jgi:putative spermidine/putrescine transport system permease protein
MAKRRIDRAGVGLRIAAGAVVLFLYAPLAIIVVNSFNEQSAGLSFPPPGFTTRWYAVAFGRSDMWQAMRLSAVVALIATAIALILGSLLAAAVYRTRFFGREAISVLVVLPIALPGIVTGMALRSSISLAEDSFGWISFGTLTIVIGHATFCVVIVYNNVLARFRRMSPSLVEASQDLGASGWQTFRHVVLPNIRTALLAGGILAFALSFDEIIVTNFTAGQQQTLPIWIFQALFRPRNQPVVNVVALIVIALTFVPILLVQVLTRDPAIARTSLGGGRRDRAGPAAELPEP